MQYSTIILIPWHAPLTKYVFISRLRLGHTFFIQNELQCRRYVSIANVSIKTNKYVHINGFYLRKEVECWDFCLLHPFLSVCVCYLLLYSWARSENAFKIKYFKACSMVYLIDKSMTHYYY